jgi:hypothetical protein
MARTKFIFDMIGSGGYAHPQLMFKKWIDNCANTNVPTDFKIVSSECYSIGDIWVFEVEHHDDYKFGYLPCYIRIDH